MNTNELLNHFTLIVFWYERCNLLCSHSNGDIFTCEDVKFLLVFHWSLYNKKFFLTIKTDNVTSSRREMDPHRQ